MKILLYHLSGLLCVAYFIGTDYPYSIGHHYRFADRGGRIPGGTIPVKSGHSSSAIYCLFRWRCMEGRKYTNVLLTCLCPITKAPFDIFLIYGFLGRTQMDDEEEPAQNPVCR